MTENQKLREEFETYITDDGKWPNAILKAPGGQYLLLRTSVAWQDWKACAEALALPTAEQVDDTNVAESFTSVTKTAAPAQEVASAFTTALDIRLAQGWNLTGNAIPVLYTDTINDYQVRRDDVWLCTTDALKTKQEVGLTASQFDLICQAIDKADTITLEGDYMLDSDDCIGVVRVMQVLFDIAALRAKGGK